jgi:hypothetical protein
VTPGSLRETPPETRASFARLLRAMADAIDLLDDAALSEASAEMDAVALPKRAPKRPKLRLVKR